MFPNETVGIRFLFAVIGFFPYNNSETTYIFSNSWTAGSFRDNSLSVLFGFQTHLTPFLLLLQPTINSQQDRSFPLPSSS